jgi:hypothetical protein
VLLNHSQLVRHPCPAANAPRPPVAPADYADREPLQQLWKAPDSRTPAFADPLRSGRLFLAADAPLRENPTWRTIVEFDREQSLAPIAQLNRQFGVIGIVAALVGLVAVLGLWLMLFRLTREAAMPAHAKAPLGRP